MDTSHRQESIPGWTERHGRSRELLGVIAAVIMLIVGVESIRLLSLIDKLPSEAPTLALVL